MDYSQRCTRLMQAFAMTCLLIHSASALDCKQFEAMTAHDRANYVTALASGTMKLLQTEGRSDEANRVFTIFATDKYDEFTKNLVAAEKLNATRSADNQLQVEHAFLLTLKQNGIVNIPQSIMAINKDFKPESGVSDPKKTGQ